MNHSAKNYFIMGDYESAEKSAFNPDKSYCYSNIPDSVGIATDVLDGKKVFSVYLTDERGQVELKRTFHSASDAYSSATELYSDLQSYLQGMHEDETSTQASTDRSALCSSSEAAQPWEPVPGRKYRGSPAVSFRVPRNKPDSELLDLTEKLNDMLKAVLDRNPNNRLYIMLKEELDNQLLNLPVQIHYGSKSTKRLMYLVLVTNKHSGERTEVDNRTPYAAIRISKPKHSTGKRDRISFHKY